MSEKHLRVEIGSPLKPVLFTFTSAFNSGRLDGRIIAMPVRLG